jgi:hypothetical protein
MTENNTPVEDTVVEPAEEVATPVEEVVEPVTEEAVAPAAEEVAAPTAEEVVEPVKEEAVTPPVDEVAPPVVAEVTEPAVETEAAPLVEAAEPAQEPAKASETPAPKTPMKPAPRPATPAAPAAPVIPIFDPAAIAAAEAFGMVDEKGNVYVIEGTERRIVGQQPSALTPSDAMALYTRRYLDLGAKVTLFETRLATADIPPRELDQTIERLTAETTEPAAIGDPPALRERVAAVTELAKERRKAIEEARAEAKAESLAKRTAVVEKAEAIVAMDPKKSQWKTSTTEMNALMDSWKEIQKSGPRLNRSDEDALWKRFRDARSTFDRERRAYFAALDANNATAKAAKEKLVAEAEKLSDSKDWGATAGAYRDLMTKWKAAGRAGRKDDDALWARFRAAQDKFFDAREADNKVISAQYGENLKVKEKLLADAETLLPVTDLAGTKATLRLIQEKWEAAGRVPREDMNRIEGRMRDIEQAVRDAESAQYARVNPEKRHRAEGALAQLEAAIDGLEADLTAAKDKGDKRKIKDIEAAIAARTLWMEQVARAAEDSRG